MNPNLQTAFAIVLIALLFIIAGNLNERISDLEKAVFPPTQPARFDMDKKELCIKEEGILIVMDVGDASLCEEYIDNNNMASGCKKIMEHGKYLYCLQGENLIMKDYIERLE